MKHRIAVPLVVALALTAASAGLQDPAARAGELFRKAQALLEAGDRAGTSKMIGEIKSIKLEHPDFHYNLALLYEGLEDFSSAETEYKEALRMDSKPEEYTLGLGALYLSRKRPEAALDVFEAAVRRSAASARIYLGIATARAALQRNEEALTAFRRAEELDPGFAGAWRSHGAFALFIDRTNEARRALQQAVRLDPRDAVTRYNLGMLMRKDPVFTREQSLEQFDKAVGLDPNLVKAWVEKAMVLRDMGRFEEAVAALENAVRLDSGISRAWYQLGMLHRRLGQFEKSKQALARFAQTKAAETTSDIRP